jgi:hypothetical protein
MKLLTNRIALFDSKEAVLADMASFHGQTTSSSQKSKDLMQSTKIKFKSQTLHNKNLPNVVSKKNNAVVK